MTRVIFEDDSDIAYDYDEEGNLITMTETASVSAGSPDPRVTRFAYFDDNLLQEVRIERPGADDRVFSYHYDDVGRPTKIVYPVETEIEALFDDGSPGTGWDKNGRLKHLRYEKDGDPIRSFEFAYDDSGNRTLRGCPRRCRIWGDRQSVEVWENARGSFGRRGLTEPRPNELEAMRQPGPETRAFDVSMVLRLCGERQFGGSRR